MRADDRDATEAGLAALQWLVQGYGWAENAGRADEVRSRIRVLVDNEQRPALRIVVLFG